jgi:hypothetical protein
VAESGLNICLPRGIDAVLSHPLGCLVLQLKSIYQLLSHFAARKSNDLLESFEHFVFVQFLRTKLNRRASVSFSVCTSVPSRSKIIARIKVY